MRLLHINCVFALTVGIVAAVSCAPAQAQLPMGPPGAGLSPHIQNDAANPKASVPPPPALPGAQPGFGAAPADKSVANLTPTDELFDAINRGDIGTARDAINRGADLGGKNVLGMTPVELSVDLSRNDITFLLLSMQGGATPAVPAKATTAQTKSASVPTPRPTPKLAVAKPVAASLPRQYAGPADPGTPAPQVGFLGFGPGVQ
jgi:hypothetical protein